MNYLAHAYLSFNNPEILVGNMISDYVKGKKQYDYPIEIQKGIRLHRAIDQFTDEHEATKTLKTFFKPQYRLYAGAFADVVYDHFLATDKKEFSTPEALHHFTSITYQQLEPHFSLFPAYFQKQFPYMKSQNWLFNYSFKWGIQKSFGGLVKRATYLTECDIAFEIFSTHYASMQICYTEFFPSLKTFTQQELTKLLVP